MKQRLKSLQNTQPDPPKGLSLVDLEQEVPRRELALSELRSNQTQLENQPSARANRRREIRDRLLSANQRRTELQDQLSAIENSDEPIALSNARRSAILVALAAIDAELPTLQNELLKYDAEDAVDLLRAQRDVVMREISLADSELKTLQSQLERKRAADSAQTLKRAKAAVESTPVSIRSHAEQIVEFARGGAGLSQPISETKYKLESSKSRLEQLQTQFTLTQQRVKDIGLTGSIGSLLRRQRSELPELRSIRRNIKDRRSLIEETQYQLFEYDDLRSESVDAGTIRILQGVNDKSESLRDSAVELVELRREVLDDVIKSYNTYLDALFDLDATEQRLARETATYQEFIDQRVLWIRSNKPLFSSLTIDGSDRELLRYDNWHGAVMLWLGDIRKFPWIHLPAIFVLAMLLWRRPALRRELDSLGEIAQKGTCMQFAPTIRAGFLTLLLALAWPGLIGFVGWRLWVTQDTALFPRALAQAFIVSAWVCFPLEILYRICHPNGLAQAHFNWPMTSITMIRRYARRAAIAGVPIVFLVTLLHASDPEHRADAIERLAFAAGMGLILYLVWQILRPDSGVFRELLGTRAPDWLQRSHRILYFACLSVPLLITGLAIAGYFYTAQQLTWRLYSSIVLLLCVQVGRDYLQRLLKVRRRAIRIEQARKRMADAAAGQSVGETSVGAAEGIVPVEELQPNVESNTEQTQRLIRTAVIASCAIGMWFIWVDTLPALRLLDQWRLWSTTTEAATIADIGDSMAGISSSGDSSENDSNVGIERIGFVTVADVGLAILIGLATFACARNIPGLMEMSVLPKLPVDNSIRYAITRVTSYLIVLLGLILAFQAMSIGWSKVQWLATALTFGLAFGLQEIFANFVAGLILLFERPIRVGDVVTVDDVTGVVSRIRIRATTITNWDRKEYVIPNREFITGRLLNWTLSDKTNRIVINIGVAYGSDINLAKSLLLKVCEDHPLILEDPPSRVTFEGFGDNTLNLVVRTFLPDLDNRLPVIDELHTEIDRVFREAQIEIAFPQRDLHVRSVDTAILANLAKAS